MAKNNVLNRLDPTIDVSIVIVSWNVADLLRACLSSVFANHSPLNIEVIVVDSASSDDTVHVVQNEFPQVKLRAMQENVGFPKGNNIGMEIASGKYIYLLNPDTVVLDNAIETMFNHMEKHPTIGMVGSQLNFPDGTIQSSRRRFPTLTTGLFESTWLEGIVPQAILNHYYVLDRPDDVISDVDWVMGASMFTRREAVEAVGGMDEGYFMYSEELDWCRRIKEAGWRIVYLPTAKIVHYQGKSSEQASTARHINFNRAKLRYFRKYHGRLASGLIRVVLLCNYLAQILLEGGKGLIGHKRDLRWQRVHAYWLVLRSGLKPAGY